MKDAITSTLGFYRAAEAVIPLRGEAAESAEMVSQLLFGEICEKIDEKPRWWRVRCLHDAYTGWLNPQMLAPLEENATVATWHMVREGALRLDDDSCQPLPIGSRIPGPVAGMPQPFRIAERMFRPSMGLTYCPSSSRSELPTLACIFLQTPYLWGGRSNWGIDCSGFTQQLFAMVGIALPRDSSQQASAGTEVQWGNHQAGDLAFFSQTTDRISHVGLVLPENKIIHASGRVRIDTLTQAGIIHAPHQDLSHHLLTIRRC